MSFEATMNMLDSPAKTSAEKLIEHLKAQGVEAAVRVGSAFGRNPLLNSTVGPALYVHLTQHDMLRLESQIANFDDYPVIYMIEQFRRHA
jgi:hypothetical protein